MSITNVYGNATILGELKSDNAKVAFFGDSIMNNAGTDFASWFQGAILTWQPDEWKGAWFNTQGAVGVWGIGAGAVGEDSAFPGAGEGLIGPAAPDFDHDSANWTRLGQKGGTTSFIYSPGFRLAMLSDLDSVRSLNKFFDVQASWPDGPKAFVDGTGDRRLATEDYPVAMGIRSLRPNSTDYVNDDGSGFQYIAYNPGSVSNSGLRNDWTLTSGTSNDYTVEQYITNTPPDTSDWNPTAGTTGGQIWQTQWRHNGGSGWFAIDAAFWGQAGDGMVLSYFGNGGWTTKSHKDEVGEPITITSGGQPRTDSWNYSTDYLTARMGAEANTHAFIALGNNDISSPTSGADSATVIADMTELMTRIRTARPGIKLIISTIYYSAADSAQKITWKDEYNDWLRNTASQQSDVCIVDMNNYVYTAKTKTEFEADWLDDNIHPNGDGSIAMMSYFWDRVEAAAALPPDNGINFSYSGITSKRSGPIEDHLDDISAANASRWAALARSASSSAPYAIVGNAMYKKLMACFRRIK